MDTGAIMDVLKSYKNGDYRVIVVYDKNAESPREWDNLGKIYINCRIISIKECSIGDIGKATVKLPIYKYDHSGISLSTGNAYPFNDRFDSCCAGYICAFEDDILKEFDEINEETIKKIKKILNSEVEILNKYCHGEVYGYYAVKVPEIIYDEDIIKYGDVIDSCFGFFDIDDALEEGKASLPEEEHMKEKIA